MRRSETNDDDDNDDYYYYHHFLDPGTSFPGCETLSSVWCLERLQWGLGNCESVRQADCIETLDCRGDPLVQECRYYYYCK